MYLEIDGDAVIRRRLILTQVEELDERMKKLTHKLENARRDMVRGAASARATSFPTCTCPPTL